MQLYHGAWEEVEYWGDCSCSMKPKLFLFLGVMDSAIDRREREFDMWEGFTLGIHVS